MGTTDKEKELFNRLTGKEFRLLAHTLGVNTYGSFVLKKDKYRLLPEKFNRNYFAATAENNRWEEVLSLVEKKLMVEHWRVESNGMHLFIVTEKGKKEFVKEFENRLCEI